MHGGSSERIAELMTDVPTLQKSPRILIVEDDPIDRAILSAALQKGGYEFAVAANGRDAIDLYSQEFFPIIISDWLMPEMDGLELCSFIRSMKTQSYIYIILLTGRESKSDLVKGLAAGADEYLVKPLLYDELLVRLKGAQRILDLELSLKRSLAEVRETSIHDPLTGAFTRGYMDQQLLQELKRSFRYIHHLSIIMCDLDHFKLVNDTYGHQTGDVVLKRCVATICATIRQGIDWVARYGGEEFVIVLPETDQPGCSIVAERLRERIASEAIEVEGGIITQTVSFGAVTVEPAESNRNRSLEEVFNLADLCLYQAKEQGRNRVVSAEM